MLKCKIASPRNGRNKRIYAAIALSDVHAVKDLDESTVLSNSDKHFIAYS